MNHYRTKPQFRYLSVCSGIEAASVAWGSLGWKPWAFSEIEPFPCAVLAHRFPDVPNLGDMTKYEDWPDANVDLLCGGTPCQSFSVAGQRRGLDDERGNLALTFCNIADKYDPEWILWENVPGVLSDKGNAFGCFLAGLTGADQPYDPRGRWPAWGVVTGPKRTAAWRVLDAQYFGVAQRRRRVFVLAVRGSRNWASAAALFPVGESMYWNSPPRREAREETAGTLASRTGAGGFPGSDEAMSGYVQPCWWDGGQVSQTLDAVLSKGQTMPEKNRFPAVLQPIAIQGAATRENPSSGPDGIGVRTDGCAYTLEARAEVQAVCITGDRTHALKGEGFDGSEDGIGRGQPIVAFPANLSGTQCASAENIAPAMGAKNPTGVAYPLDLRNALRDPEKHDEQNRQGVGTGDDGDPAPTLTKAHVHGVVACRDVAGTITSNYGKQVDSSDTGLGPNVVFPAMQVRRLTPRECERLQGFPDDYTLVPFRGKPAADGPRYKAIGNSWAVPCAAWIGCRIDFIESHAGEIARQRGVVAA